jgi:hypothetical protein
VTVTWLLGHLPPHRLRALGRDRDELTRGTRSLWQPGEGWVT